MILPSELSRLQSRTGLKSESYQDYICHQWKTFRHPYGQNKSAPIQAAARALKSSTDEVAKITSRLEVYIDNTRRFVSVYSIASYAKSELIS